jgi:hypothetical protein
MLRGVHEAWWRKAKTGTPTPSPPRFALTGFHFAFQRAILPCGLSGLMEGSMTTQNWIIAAVVVLLIIIVGYFLLRPTGEMPAGTTPPATTEQPAEPAPAN